MLFDDRNGERKTKETGDGGGWKGKGGKEKSGRGARWKGKKKGLKLEKKVGFVSKKHRNSLAMNTAVIITVAV
jgi:hypothetical protein